MAEWTPPAKLLPITPEVYARLRMMIDGGTKIAQARLKNINEGCKNYCTPGSDPKIQDMAVELYKYIPVASLPLPAETQQVTMDGELESYSTDDSDRPSIITFEIDRKVMIGALDDVTPIGVLEKFNEADPNDEGLPWWAVALSAAGVFALLGKLNWRGALLSRVAAKLLGILAAAGLFPDLSEGAKQVIEGAKKAAKAAIGALPLVVGGIAGVAVIALALRSSPKPQPQTLQLQLPRGGP